MSEPNLFTAKKIKKLLIPLIFEQFMIVLVGLVDTMLLSHVSESALSAFSLVDNLNLLLMQVFMAVAPAAPSSPPSISARGTARGRRAPPTRPR